MFLYNSHKLRKFAKKAPIFQLYKPKYLPNGKDKSLLRIITLNGIKRLLRDTLSDDFNANFIDDKDVRYGERIERFMVINLIKFLSNCSNNRIHLYCKKLNF